MDSKNRSVWKNPAVGALVLSVMFNVICYARVWRKNRPYE